MSGQEKRLASDSRDTEPRSKPKDANLSQMRSHAYVTDISSRGYHLDPYPPYLRPILRTALVCRSPSVAVMPKAGLYRAVVVVTLG